MRRQINTANRGAFYAIVALIILVAFLSYKANSQSIGVGIGYTSSGDVPVSLSVSGKKLGGYVSYIAEKHHITEDYTGIWHNETLLGVSYKIMQEYPQLSVISAVGWNKTIEFMRETAWPNAIYSEETYGKSYEVGFEIQVFEKCKFLYLNCAMNNYSGLKSTVSLKHTFSLR